VEHPVSRTRPGAPASGRRALRRTGSATPITVTTRLGSHRPNRRLCLELGLCTRPGCRAFHAGSVLNSGTHPETRSEANRAAQCQWGRQLPGHGKRPTPLVDGLFGSRAKLPEGPAILERATERHQAIVRLLLSDTPPRRRLHSVFPRLGPFTHKFIVEAGRSFSAVARARERACRTTERSSLGTVLLLRAGDQVLSVSFFTPAYGLAAALTRSAFSPGSAFAAP